MQGIHLMNHALRKFYNSENSIIQTNSYVKNNSFKLEFKFGESLIKPSLEDVKGIEQICQDSIGKSLRIYTSDNVPLTEEVHAGLKYPLRKLNDVLYPKNVRVVSIGAEWKAFLDKKAVQNEDSYAELCCGTHASNTNELKSIAISRLNIVGDSSYEIEASTSDFALENPNVGKQKKNI